MLMIEKYLSSLYFFKWINCIIICKILTDRIVNTGESDDESSNDSDEYVLDSE